MTDEPTFPQESPAMKYIVGQISRIENVEACSTGYYKTLGTVISRLDRTDVELNRLNLQLRELKEIIDFAGVSKAITKNTEVMALTVENGLSKNISEIGIKFKMLSDKQFENNIKIAKDIKDISDRLDKHIRDINQRVIPPLWKIYFYTFVAVVVGIGIDRWFL